MLASTPTLSLIQGNALLSAARRRDTTPPIVSITAPQKNSTIYTTPTSAALTIKATATDDRSGIANVKFYVDKSTTPIVTDTSSPYSFTWATTNISGTHTFKAVAQDGSGNVSTPAVVSVNFVFDNVLPTVAITSPTPSSTVSGTQILTANASDTQSGIASVEFMLDNNTSLGIATNSPSSTSSIPWDTTKVAPGLHSLTAVALDKAGNKTTSTPISVIVNNNNPVVTPTAIPVISFHGIGTDQDPYDMPQATFTADMKALHDAGYHSITLQQYLDWEAGKNPVLPSKPILLTDDDGDASIDGITG